MRNILLVVCMAWVLTACSAPATDTPSPAVSPSPTQSADASAPTPDATPATPNQTEGKTIIVGLDDNFPPMGFRDDNGEIVGFDIDLAKEAAARMGVNIEFQPIDWKAKELELKAKKIDVLWNGLTITEPRKENMLFTQAYLKNRQVIVVTDASGIKTKADLAGKIIGLQNDSSAVDAVDKDETFKASIQEPVKYDNNVLAFQDLGIGRIDAVVVDEIVAKYYMTNNTNNFVLLEEHLGEEEYGIATRLEETELRDQIQTALKSMSDDGTATKISEKWFGGDIFLPQQ